MKVLVTGGSGFIASHCVKTLLASNHTVVTTVRSAEKGEKVLAVYPESSKGQVSYVVVPDIAQEGAFDQVVVSDPPFDAVLHTASPFHFRFQGPKELLDPAIHGTKGILRTIKDKAPSVKRVVITSSFAALVSTDGHPDVYSENQWNPVTYEEGIEDRAKTYRASCMVLHGRREARIFACNSLPSLCLWTSDSCSRVPTALNTSNAYFAMLMHGGWKEQLPPTGTWLWVDVRDIALAHVRVMEVPEAGGKRFIITAGHFDMKEVAEIAKKNFPEYADKLPTELTSDKPNPLYGFDNSRSKEILKLEYRSLKTSAESSHLSGYLGKQWLRNSLLVNSTFSFRFYANKFPNQPIRNSGLSFLFARH